MTALAFHKIVEVMQQVSKFDSGCLAKSEGTTKNVSELQVDRNYDLCNAGRMLQPLNNEKSWSVTEVVGSILTWSSEIFSIVPSPVAKKSS